MILISFGTLKLSESGEQLHHLKHSSEVEFLIQNSSLHNMVNRFKTSCFAFKREVLVKVFLLIAFH